MTLNEKFSRACNPDRWTILGRRLLPLTVARANFLEQIGFDSGKVKPEDLLAAIELCSVWHWRGRRYLARGGRRVWHLRALLLFYLRPGSFEHAAASFQKYLDHHRASPDFWHDSKQTRDCTCPTLLMIERDLMAYYGYRPREIARMPIGEAQWRRLAMLEASGAIEFKTDEDVEMLEEFRRIAKEEHEQSLKAKEVACGNG